MNDFSSFLVFLYHSSDTLSGVLSVAQRAALAAITGPQDCVRGMVEEYEKRRKIIHEGLNEISERT
jgi:aspartate aminotransferase